MRFSAILPAALLALVTLLPGCGDARKSTSRFAENENLCVACHGGQDNQTGAPPFDLAGDSDTALAAVGAHTAHVQTAALAAPLGCAECHQDVPSVTSPRHMNGTVDLPFGDLSKTGGAAPTFDRATMTCAATYCHGATLQGGTHTSPVWTRVGQGEAACGTCHGLPPATAASGARHPAGNAVTDCHKCHPGTVDRAGAILVAGGLHVNGMVEVRAMSCVGCHGGQDNQTGAPPFDLGGNSGSTLPGVGAHTAHVQTAALAAPFACAECHEAVPQILNPGHMDGTVDLPFGQLSRTGGVTPAFDPGTMGCSTTYCHGATLQGGTHTSPVWTRVGQGEAACGTCHSLPPTQLPGPNHPTYQVAEARCAGCHYGTADVDAAGGNVILAGGGLHVNGVVDFDFAGHPAGWYVPGSGGDHAGPGKTSVLTCATASCHGTDLAGGRSGIACSRCHDGGVAKAFNCVLCHGGQDNQTGAPPVDLQGLTATTSIGVGAHSSHVTAAHGISQALDCGACHVKPATVGDPGHVDGAVTVTWGSLARADGAAPSWNRSAATCSSTYCHGNFTGGLRANAPSWTTLSPPQAACGSCHVIPSDTGSQTGEHQKHMGKGLACSACHVDGTTATTVDPATHVNGVKDLRAGDPPGWDPVARTCANKCHGEERW